MTCLLKCNFHLHRFTTLTVRLYLVYICLNLIFNVDKLQTRQQDIESHSEATGNMPAFPRRTPSKFQMLVRSFTFQNHNTLVAVICNKLESYITRLHHRRYCIAECNHYLPSASISVKNLGYECPSFRVTIFTCENLPQLSI